MNGKRAKALRKLAEEKFPQGGRMYMRNNDTGQIIREDRRRYYQLLKKMWKRRHAT